MQARLTTVLGLTAAMSLAACDDDPVTSPEEPRTFAVTIENVSMTYAFPASGSFARPVGADAAGPLLPGASYEFDVSATPGSRLSLATMFVQSNDWFYAPDGEGIALWEPDGTQRSGDVTDELILWDAGTEEDSEPGLGADQAPRQSGPNTGASDDDDTVRPAADEWGNVPATSDVIRVTINPTTETTFRVRVENVGTATTLMTSDGAMHPVLLAPGVWVVHTDNDPLFSDGSPDRGDGLEALAEDGAVTSLADVLEARTGIVSPIAPGAFAVHREPSIMFSAGQADMGLGLEALAEDGAASDLAAALANQVSVSQAGAFDTPDGASAPGPVFPGGRYSFEITAEPGDRLSFATMYVQSNDLFFSPAETGIDLFPGGTALTGDVTGMILLWDAGTEVNEKPGFGLSQAPRQPAADSGADEAGVVRQVNDGYQYPAVTRVIRVTIAPTS